MRVCLSVAAGARDSGGKMSCRQDCGTTGAGAKGGSADVCLSPSILFPGPRCRRLGGNCDPRAHVDEGRGACDSAPTPACRSAMDSLCV